MWQSCTKKPLKAKGIRLFKTETEILKAEKQSALGEKKKLRDMGFNNSEAFGSCFLAVRGACRACDVDTSVLSQPPAGEAAEALGQQELGRAGWKRQMRMQRYHRGSM